MSIGATKLAECFFFVCIGGASGSAVLHSVCEARMDVCVCVHVLMRMMKVRCERPSVPMSYIARATANNNTRKNT